MNPVEKIKDGPWNINMKRTIRQFLLLIVKPWLIGFREGIIMGEGVFWIFYLKKKIEIIICLIRERDNGGGWVGV